MGLTCRMFEDNHPVLINFWKIVSRFTGLQPPNDHKAEGPNTRELLQLPGLTNNKYVFKVQSKPFAIAVNATLSQRCHTGLLLCELPSTSQTRMHCCKLAKLFHGPGVHRGS